VVIGKGSSVTHIPASSEFKIAACSEAIRMCDRADWLAVNDVPAFESLDASDLRRADAIVLPNFLHVTPPPIKPGPNDLHCFRSHTTFAPAISAAKCKLITYCLHTDPYVAENSRRLPFFGRCRSISDSLIAYLLYLGHREIVTTGIEWNGAARYHPDFRRQVAKTVRHRKAIWSDTVKRIITAGGSVFRWEDSRINPENQ